MQDFSAWIHGAREMEIFSIATKREGQAQALGELSEHEAQLMQAVCDRNLAALKRLQLKKMFECKHQRESFRVAKV